MNRSYRLKMGGVETAWELFHAARFDLADVHMPAFLDSLTSIGSTPTDEYEDILVPIRFQDEKFYPRLTDILRALKRRRLNRPTPEHAFRFAIQYPDAQRICPHIFPHEPWTESYKDHDVEKVRNLAGQPRVLSLIGNESGRRADLSSTLYRWSSGHVYFGVIPRSRT